MQIDVTVQDANNILCEVTPPQPQIIVIDRGVEGNGIVSIVPVTISTFQYLRITYTNGTVQDVGPLTSTAYTATAPITIVGNTISLATVPIASGGTDATTAAGAIQNLLPSYTGNGGKRLGLNSGATALEWVLDGGGTVTSVAASGGTTGLTFTGSPITTSGTLTLGGTLAIANGGTGVTTSTGTGSVVLSTSPTLVTPLLGTPTSGNFSTGTFTWPTFNQNTTGTAANVTGVVAIANGGTGQTTANAALNALLPTQTGNASKYLQTDGTNATWDAISLSTADITGILPTANGGTGLSSFTANRVLYTSSTSAIGQSANLTFDGSNLVNGGNFSTGTSGLATYFRASGTAYTQIGDNQTLGAGTAFVIGSSTPYLAGNVAGGEQMRLTTTGLGVGTSSPTVKLDVSSAITNGYTPIIRLTRPSATLNDQFLAFYNGIATDAQIGRLKNSDDLLFGFNSGVSFSAAMTLATSGNLGIGVSAPSVKLSVAGDAIVGTQNDTRLLLSNGSISEYYTSETTPRWFIGRDAISGGQAGIGFGPTGSVSIATGGSAVGIPTTRTLGFFTSNGTSLTERARIDSVGNFGIGTTSLTSKLTVGSTGSSIELKQNGTGSATYYVMDNTIESGGKRWRFGYTGAAGIPYFSLYNQTDNVLAWASDSSGNLGVGTASPTTKLSITDSSGPIIRMVRTSNRFEVSADTDFMSLNARDASTYITFKTADTERARIDSSGNMQIGTTTNAGRLTVSGKIRTLSGDIELDSGQITTNSSTYALRLGVDGVEKARIDSSGRLSLGIVSLPANASVGLYASFNSSSLGVIGARNGSGKNTFAVIGDSNFECGYLGTSSPTGTDALLEVNGTNGVRFTTSVTERARIAADGKFYLGVTSGIGQYNIRSDARISGTNTYYAQTISATAVADTGGYTTMIGMGVEGNAWSKGAIGYTRTSAYDRGYIGFYLNPTADSTTCALADEKMRLDYSGNLLVGTTSQLGVGKVSIAYAGASAWGMAFKTTGQDNSTAIVFRNSSDTSVGSIQTTTSATSYVTSSDYRLKNTIAPMIGALAKVALLKPCTYKWNVDGSDGQGFIAHELAEVVPQCVTGEKDAVDADGKPHYQGIDTSFLVATLTAAIQEQQAIIESLKARLDAANL